MTVLMLLACGLVLVVMSVWWIWIRSEERKQRERMRQTVNGGGGDLWAQWHEKRRHR